MSSASNRTPEPPRRSLGWVFFSLLAVSSLLLIFATLGLSSHSQPSSTTTASAPSPSSDSPEPVRPPGASLIPPAFLPPFSLLPTFPVAAPNSKWVSEPLPNWSLVRPSPELVPLLPDGAVDVGGGWFSVPSTPDSDLPDLGLSEPVHWVDALVEPPGGAWWLNQAANHDVDAPEGWSRATGFGVTVAVIDTGVDIAHPALHGAIWRNPGENCDLRTGVGLNGHDDDGNGFVDDCHGWNFAAGSNQVFVSSASDTHGTHVAGIVSGRPISGAPNVGVAPSSQVMVVKFMDGSRGRTDHAAAAINYAIANGAKVLNLSWGSLERSQAVDDAIADAVSKGVVVVAAAGNHGANLSSSPMYPAASLPSGGVAVAAHTSTGALAQFSAFGPKVGLSAPGVGITSTLPGGVWGAQSGTSMASPMVAGAAALYLDAYPGALPSRVVSALKASAAPRGHNTSTGGILKSGALLGTSTPPATVEVSVSDAAFAPGDPVGVRVSAFATDGAPSPATLTLPSGVRVEVSPGEVFSFPAPASSRVYEVSASPVGHPQVSASASFAVSTTPGDFAHHPLPYRDGVFDTGTALTSHPDELLCVPAGASLYFSLGDLPAGLVSFSTAGSDFDTVLGVFDLSGSSPKLVGCRDDLSPGRVRHSELSVELPSSVEKRRSWVLVAAGYAGDSGTLRISSALGSAPADGLISGPVELPEGSSATYSAPGGFISVPALSVAGPVPLSVSFPRDGVFAVLWHPESPPSSVSDAESALTVSVANAPPQVSASVEVSAASATLRVSVSDPGSDRVRLEGYSLDGRASLSTELSATPFSREFSLSSFSGWFVLTATDADSSQTRLALNSSGFSISPPGGAGDADDGDDGGGLPSLPRMSLSVRKVSGDLFGDGSVVEVGVSPGFDRQARSPSAVVAVSGRVAFSDSSGVLSPLVMRGLCISPGRGLVLVQAGSPSATDVFFMPLSGDTAAPLLPPRRLATAQVPPVSVTGCLAGSGVSLETLSGSLPVLSQLP